MIFVKPVAVIDHVEQRTDWNIAEHFCQLKIATANVLRILIEDFHMRELLGRIFVFMQEIPIKTKVPTHIV